MDSYKETIKNHQKLDLNEVKMFLDEQINTYELKNYIEGISYKNDLLGCAEYNLNTKYIYLSDDYDLDLKAELLRLPKNKFLTTILYNNDIYNLSIINSIFHELRHAYQKKIVDTDHTSLQSLLFSLNFALICKYPEFYSGFHDRYSIEYDAILYAIKHTLELTKYYKFSPKALFVLNQHYAKTLLSCYGLDSGKSIFQEYNSPFDFTNFFLDHHFHIDKKTLKRIKNMLKNVYISDLKEQFLYGYNLPFDMMETLYKIEKGKIKTKNILQELDIDENIKIKTLK